MAKSIMVISFCVPYDNSGHAGGKTHNFYLKKFKTLPGVKVNLISFGVESDREHIDLEYYGIGHHIFYISKDKWRSLKRGIQNLGTKYNPFDKRGNMLPKYYEDTVIKELKRIKKKGHTPDLFVLEWTQMVFLAKQIKELFPEAKLVASEHDVSYLGFKRRWEYAKTEKEKRKLQRFYNNVKKEELEALSYCDLICPHNEKDADLLIADGVPAEKVFPIVAYFDNYAKIQRKPKKYQLMFYGAMKREENYLSAIWFIEHVLPQLQEYPLEFVVVGSNPEVQLLQAAEEYNATFGAKNGSKVTVTGFVQTVNPYFEESACLVAPLVLGAGIKVKILEAMSGGVPVLTNEIGIEGIPATDGKEYLHCTTPEEYVQAIKNIMEEAISLDEISEHAKAFINQQFSMEESAKAYLKRLSEL